MSAEANVLKLSKVFVDRCRPNKQCGSCILTFKHIIWTNYYNKPSCFKKWLRLLLGRPQLIQTQFVLRRNSLDLKTNLNLELVLKFLLQVDAHWTIEFVMINCWFIFTAFGRKTMALYFTKPKIKEIHVIWNDIKLLFVMGLIVITLLHISG